MHKKVWIAFVSVLIGFFVMDYIVHQVVLKANYDVLIQDKVFRAAGDSHMNARALSKEFGLASTSA